MQALFHQVREAGFTDVGALALTGYGKDLLKDVLAPGNYGRIVNPDGTEQWWVRSSTGALIALRHERVMINEDGSITLLLLA